ncbi:MAG: type II toxin-antitoxin system RelE/ParE family toxin [Firmicutes bacterium]|nr:type II toxin-antitoxin system RelE/ParE family toxin [Bacillota bacterium]
MKQYDVHFTPTALDDLHLISDYLTEKSAYAAHNVRQRIVAKAEDLCIFPNRGKSVSALGYYEPAYRFVAEGKFYIFYKVIGEHVKICRIWHSARDIGELLSLLDFDDSEEQDQ